MGRKMSEQLNDLVCCPFCLSMDPNKVGTEKATYITCRHPYHCPAPQVHGNPFRYCPYCSWTEDGEPVTPEAIRKFHTLAQDIPAVCSWCREPWPCSAIRNLT